MVFIRGSNI